MKVVVQYKQRKCKKCQQKLVYDSKKTKGELPCVSQMFQMYTI